MKTWKRIALYTLSLTLLGLILGPQTFGQGVSHSAPPVALTRGGFPAAGARVTVCLGNVTVIFNVNPPCAPYASIFSDSAMTQAIVQPGFTTDGLGNYPFFTAANATYTVVLDGNGLKGYSYVWNAPITNGNPASFTNLTVSGTLNCTIVNLVRCVSDTNPQAWAGTTPDAWITSAIANCPSTGCRIEVSLTAPTFAATVAVNKNINFVFAPGTYTGPSAGSMFTFGSGSHGSSMIGAGATSRGAGSTGVTPITKFISNASNTSNVIVIANGGSPVQGIRLEHFMVDGASSAANCFFSDTMQTSAWYDLDAENCTSVGYNFTTTSGTANVGNQLNVLTHLRGYGSPQLFLATSTVTNADFTANTMVDLQGNYGVGASSACGIELANADGNVFEGVTKPFRASGTGFALCFDAPSGGFKGAISNQIYEFYGMSTNNVTVGAGATGNFIYGYDVTNGEPAPVGAGNLLMSWQPNSPVAGVISGLVMPNNTCMAWWNSTGGSSGDCIIKFDSSNNLHFTSQETASYFFDSGGGEVSPNTGITQPLGSITRPWSNVVTKQLSMTNLLASSTAPTIAAAGCGGAAAAITAPNGTGSFEVSVGTTPGSACTITMPAATTSWTCDANTVSATTTTNFYVKQTGALSTTSVVLTLFSDVAAATAFQGSDTLRVKCSAN